MYKPSKALVLPQNTRQRMWRYLTEERFRQLIQSRTLYFRRVSRFEDGLEGKLTLRSRQRLLEWFTHKGSTLKTAMQEIELYETHSQAFFASCWHMNDHESYLMWKAYAGMGVAISTTYERLQASFEDSPGAVTGGMTTYVDFERDHTGLGQVFTHVTTKDLPYADEREFRLLLWKNDPRNNELALDGDGVAVPINIPMLIACVVRNPFQPELPPDLIRQLEILGIPYDGSSVRAQPPTRS